jgi:hypothetical protein
MVDSPTKRTIAQQILANYNYANSRYEFVIYFFVEMGRRNRQMRAALYEKKATCKRKE